MLSLVDFLNKAGYEVYVLTSDGVDFGYLGYGEIVDKAKIVYLHDPLKITTQKAVRSQIGTKGAKGTLLPRLLRVLKSVLYELLVPDPGVLMRKKYLEAASGLITENNIANVIVSSPPHSMQLVGLALKKRFGEKINLAVDYRDSWNGGAIFRQKTAIGEMIARSIEKRVLKYCDHFLYVSAPILDKAKLISPGSLDKKSHLVMNGFDDTVAIPATAEKKSGNKKIRVGHFGMVNDVAGSYRNVKKIIEVIAGDPEISDKVQFEFYGQAKLSGDYKKEGILFFDNLSYIEARKKMLEMDYLMMFHATSGDSDEVITGKFFEYVASEKPIICISPEDMEARRLVARLGIGLVADIEDADEMRHLMLDLPRLADAGYYAGVDASDFSRSKQYEKILPLLR